MVLRVTKMLLVIIGNIYVYIATRSNDDRRVLDCEIIQLLTALHISVSHTESVLDHVAC
jgi:hypothetical protein